MSKQRPKQKRREGRAVGATEGREESSMRLVEDAVNLKDQQIALIRRENQKLMDTINNLEEDNIALRGKLVELDMACSKVQDENLHLAQEAKGRYEEGRLFAETSLRRQIDSSHHQLKVMAEQNTELLRLLEVEEKRGSDSLGRLKEVEHKYKESIEKMTKIRSEVEEEKRELRERLRDAQQSERELFKELEATKEKGKGQLIQIGKLEEKLVQVSNANVELQASLLRAENTAEETDIAANAAKEEAIAKLDNENTRLSGLLTVERNERARLEEQTKAQAVQLKDMADKTFQLIERIKTSEKAKAPAERAVEKLTRKVNELRTKLLRAEEDRVEAEKMSKRCLKELQGKQREMGVVQQKVQDLKSLREKDRVARERDIQARKDAEDRNKILSGKLAYLINKSAIDDENQASARQDVKRLELQLQQALAEKVALDRENRSAKEANRVLAEAMQIKQKELEKMEIESQIRAVGEEDEVDQKDEAKGGFSSSSNEHKRHGVYRIHTQPQRGREALAYGIKVRKNAPKFAATVLERIQINGFLRYAARQPESKHLQCCADKFVQIMNIMCEDAESEDQRVKRSTEIQDRLRTELDLLKRKSSSLQDRLCSEEEHKRKSLLKYLHAVISGQILGGSAGSASITLGYLEQKEGNNGKRDAIAEGKSGKFDIEQKEVVDGVLETPAPPEIIQTRGMPIVGGKTKAIQLHESGIGDEEMHALVAVLNGHDVVSNIDLRNNNVTDVGARALATLARGSKMVTFVDLRGNFIGKTGIRHIAESLEQNKRSSHVYVHQTGKIEVLGPVESVDDDLVGGGMTTPAMERHDVDFGARNVDTIVIFDIRDQRSQIPAAAILPVEKASKDGLLARKIEELERSLGPRVRPPPENEDEAQQEAVEEADLWAKRAEETEKAGGTALSLDNVETDWLGTEVAPTREGYESPLAKRIRKLETELAEDVAGKEDEDEEIRQIGPKLMASFEGRVYPRNGGGVRRGKSWGSIGSRGKGERGMTLNQQATIDSQISRHRKNARQRLGRGDSSSSSSARPRTTEGGSKRAKGGNSEPRPRTSQSSTRRAKAIQGRVVPASRSKGDEDVEHTQSMPILPSVVPKDTRDEKERQRAVKMSKLARAYGF